MSAAFRAEPWLRGPVEGIARALMPVAHSWMQVREEVERGVRELSVEDLWSRPGGAASVGFHLQHFLGSTDRLMTYARGESLSAAQLTRLSTEREPADPPATAAQLLDDMTRAIDGVLAQLGTIDVASLQEPREVGRLKLPSTVQGLLFHAAEHAQRHAGQIVTTAKIVRGLREGR